MKISSSGPRRKSSFRLLPQPQNAKLWVKTWVSIDTPFNCLPRSFPCKVYLLYSSVSNALGKAPTRIIGKIVNSEVDAVGKDSKVLDDIFGDELHGEDGGIVFLSFYRELF